MDDLLGQLTTVRRDFEELEQSSKDDDISDQPKDKVVAFVTRARSAIHRISGRKSAYFDQCEEIIREKTYPGAKARQLYGVIQSLQSDIKAGYLQSFTEVVHAHLFADFLDMSQHLLDQGYKDAAAVIAGSSLEAHLRQLCNKAAIDTETKTSTSAVPKKAERLNSDLASANVFSKLDQKSVTAWLDLRHKAAHGRYNEYRPEQVALLIPGIRDFITRYPA